MRLILIGCEYTGKTTLASQISKWWKEKAGISSAWHDHFERPFLESSGPEAEEEAKQVITMTPTLLEKYTRYMIHYHLSQAFYEDNNHLLINWYYSDAVYAPLYYGYGGIDAYCDRQAMARTLDSEVLNIAPETVLVLLKAAPDVIRQRQRENPHPWCLLKEKDVEQVLERFEEEYTRSRIRRRFTLDTTDTTVDRTLREFLLQWNPHLTDSNRQALLSHETLKQAFSSP